MHQDSHTLRLQRDQLSRWFHTAMLAMQPEACFKREVKVAGRLMTLPDGAQIDLLDYRKIWLFGAGKGACSLARGVLDVLGDVIEGGVVIGPASHLSSQDSTFIDLKVQSKVVFLPGDHPLPSHSSVSSTSVLLETASHVNSDDLVLFVLTGGASAMLCKPVEGLSLEQKQFEFQRLLTSGASIHEMNAHRRKLSQVKGGKLLNAFNGADVINLVLSDVPGDDLNTIGSAPTQPFDSDYSIATPQTRVQAQPLVWNTLIATPGGNARYIADLARAEGYHVIVDDDAYTGSTLQIAQRIVNDIRDVQNTMRLEETPGSRVLIYYGESEVRVKGEGKGGRNQHLALQLSMMLASLKSQALITILSAGTDGIDGNTDAAGAICTESTALVAQEMGLSMNDCLQNFDSYTFFTKIGDIFETGPTGTNLTDLQIVIVHASL